MAAKQNARSRRPGDSLVREVARLKRSVNECRTALERLTEEHALTVKRIGALQAEVDDLRTRR